MRRIFPVLAAALFSAVLAHADWPSERDTFAAAFGSQEPGKRVEAVRGLKEFDHAEGMTVLLECYGAEKDSDVRRALADKMNLIYDPKAREVFHDTILKHPDPETRARYCAVFADARMIDRSEMLRLLMQDTESLVRARCLRYLAASDTAILDDAGKLLADPVPDVRMAACSALAAVKSKLAVPALIQLLEMEKEREIRWAAGDALRQITGQEFAEDVASWKKWWAEWDEKAAGPVGRALKKGADYLKPYVAVQLNVPGAAAPAPDPNSPWAATGQGVELLIYALIHAGVPQDDPVMQAGIEYLLTAPLQENYNVSIVAMALSDLNAMKYRERLGEIAQWLVDRQCENGQWTYNFMSGVQPPATETPAGKKPEKKTPSETAGRKGDTRAEPDPIRILMRGTKRAASGDNSNTQFSLLGLRATLDGGCEIPKIVWERSLRWFQHCQVGDGGWGYNMGVSGRDFPYGSMTLTGLASVVICMRALGQDDELQVARLHAIPAIKKGLDWMKKNWSVETNTGMNAWTYYYIYSIERAGMILGIDRFGDHDWYKEGCDWLLPKQGENGAWKNENPLWDTCFAILFLKKATKGYTVSGSEKKK